MPLDAFTNTFAGNPLDRASYRRSDEEWIAGRLADPESLAVILWNGRPLLENAKDGSNQLAYVSAGMARGFSETADRLLFMGLWKETAVFALDLEGPQDPADGPLEGLGRFEDLRSVAPTLPTGEAAIAATAKGVFEWRRRHRHCSVCGEPTVAAEAGWKRTCPSCKSDHFPRTDPVVIMLAVRGNECLVGRQAVWPKLMYSALAGFLEPGETIEEACARELWEEANLRTRKVRYHSTQPWPYPSSLMIGLIAEVEDGEAVADHIELEEVKWLTRSQAQAMIRGDLAEAKAPGALAIAHQLIRAWAFEGE
ncbi:MAG: NAD(+) diphosphatase [Caulobacteraceae bacterium]|nr:NAD(+) diphosphatase [Caulobacteraceae bacterium]